MDKDVKAIDTGGPAFACAAENGHQPGMSVRDYFAATVLQGAMSSAENLGSLDAETLSRMMEAVASLSYKMADAMLSERAKAST